MTSSGTISRPWPTVLCVLLAGAVAVAAASGERQSPVALSVHRPIAAGDEPRHVFAEPPWNSVGVTELADLRGRPLLVEFWGPRCAPCVGSAVPAVLRLQETFGEDLGVLFVEAQGSGRDASMSFATAQRWLGGRAMWTSEAPFDPPSRALPACVLLGRDGRVLLAGNPLTLHKEIERQVAEQVKSASEPPPGTHAELTPAWNEYTRSRFTSALSAVSAARAARPDDAAFAAEADATTEAFKSGIEARFRRVDQLLDAALSDEAAEWLDVLAKGVRGTPMFETRAAAARARLEDPARAAEREAARVLGRVRARFFDSGGDPERALDLQRFAEQHAGSVLAQRALEIARWARAR